MHQRISGPDYGLPMQHRGRGLLPALPPRVDLLPRGYTFGRGYPADSVTHSIPRIQAPGTGGEEMETGDAKTGDEEGSGEDRGRTTSKI